MSIKRVGGDRDVEPAAASTACNRAANAHLGARVRHPLRCHLDQRPVAQVHPAIGQRSAIDQRLELIDRQPNARGYSAPTSCSSNATTLAIPPDIPPPPPRD